MSKYLHDSDGPYGIKRAEQSEPIRYMVASQRLVNTKGLSTNPEPLNIPKLLNSEGFSLWPLYMMGLMRRAGVLYVLTHDPHDAEVSMGAVKISLRSTMKNRDCTSFFM